MAEENDGKALEHLVAALEKALATKAESANVKVRSRMRLKDRTTGRLREHDVVLEFNQGHHSLLVAIECRDRSRPIGVPQVEAFGAKCQDTGISQGVIVATKGFYNTARTKAQHLGIRCLDIEEVERFDWLLTPGIQCATKSLLSSDWTFYPTEAGVVEKDEMEVVDEDGNVLTMAALTANAHRQLTALLPDAPEPIEDAEIKVKFPGAGLHLRSTKTGETVPVKFALARIRYSVKVENIPFRLVQYQANDANDNITDAAYADVQFGENEARLMIVYKEEEGGQVVIVPKGQQNA